MSPPSLLLPLYVQRCERYDYVSAFQTLSRTPRAIYRSIKFCHICTACPQMLTWWRGNRKYILGNCEKSCARLPILNLLIKSRSYFQWLLSYFHAHLTWICCWHDFLMSLFAGSAIWLTNKFRKWTEMYGLKLCLRNVRQPARTRRFWYHIRVLFIVLARLCRCVVMDRHMKSQDGA